MNHQVTQNWSEHIIKRVKPQGVRDGVLGGIGETPVLEFRRYLDRGDIELFVKVEGLNPGGSAKDRPAKIMIEHALAKGALRAGQTVVESSSGNMGIGLAQVCRYYGLNFICVVDPNAQRQNVAIIEALGGKIELVEKPIDGDFLSARLARVAELLLEVMGSYWPNQYANIENPRSHRNGTATELDDLFEGDIDYIFVATSSTGTARGVQDLLRERGRSTQVIAVDALGSKLFKGTPAARKIPGMGAGMIPKLAAKASFDGVIKISDLRCVAGCRRAAKREAFLPGGSGGGVLEAVRSVQEEIQGSRVAAILHDSGTRYLETIYNDHWVEEELGCSRETLEMMTKSPNI